MSRLHADEGISLTIDKIEDIDKERLFKMALNDESEANTLLAFYRDRINAFDRERAEWLQKLETVKQSQAEAHKQQWELQKRREEIGELQRSLNESKLSLYNERQQILRLVRENDQLKVKELEDRKKLSELMALNEPVEQEVVMYKDLRPETVKRYVKNDLSLEKNKDNFENALKKSGGFSSNRPGSGIGKGGKNVIKTIYLPNEQLNTVTLENENLRRQMDGERQTYLEEIRGLREELRLREEEMKKRYDLDQDKIRELIEKNQKLESDNVLLAKEYFATRLRMNDTEKRLHEENEVLRLKNTAIANKLKIHIKQSEVENQVSKELAEKRSEEYSNKFRSQIKSKDENITILKDQYAQVQQIYLQKVKELEDNLTKLAQRYQALENRRLLENEGFQTDIRNLKRRLKDLDDTQRFRKSKSQLKKSKGESVAEEEYDEDDDDAITVDSEELDLIKKQLAELEGKLDRSRKMREI